MPLCCMYVCILIVAKNNIQYRNEDLFMTNSLTDAERALTSVNW